MDLSLLFNILSTIGFGVAILLISRIQKNLIGNPSRIFLSLFLVVYFIFGAINILKYLGPTSIFHRYEFITELLFPPIFLFFILPIFTLYVFSLFMKHDMYERMQAEKVLRQSEEKFRNLSEEIGEGVAIVAETGIQWTNKALPLLFRCDAEQLMGSELASLIDQPEALALQRKLAERKAGGDHVLERLETTGRTKDGTTMLLEVSGKVINFDGARALQVIVRDITERKRQEEKLQESERRFRNLFENASEGICISQGRQLLSANQALLELFGSFSPQNLADRPEWQALVDRIDQGLRPDSSPQATESNSGLHFEHRILRPDGTTRDVEIVSDEIEIDKQPCVQSSFRDVTERKLAALALENAKNEWERTFHTVPDLIALLDREHKIVRLNKALAERLEIIPGEVTGMNFFTLVHGDEDDSEQRRIIDSLDQHDSGPLEIYEHRPDGHYLVTISALRDNQGGVSGYVRVARDITELKRIEQELDSTRAFLQSVIDGVTDSIMVIDRGYRVRLLNRTATNLHANLVSGSAPPLCHVLSHHQDSPCHGEDHPCPLQMVVQSGESVTVIHNHTRSDGSKYVVEIGASPIFDETGAVSGIIEVGRDITEKIRLQEEQKKLETRLFQDQKNQSIATLASGIAHDFNNMLGTVLGNVELIQMGISDPEEECGMLEAVGSAAQRMSDLTRQMLAYAKGGTCQLKHLVLNTTIAESLKMSRAGRNEAIGVKLELERELWPVTCDPGQMCQMLVNLFNNGFEALESQESREGTLRVRTANTSRCEDWECSNHNSHRAGDYILIEISDNGPGIPPELLSTVFDPFVTSKALGRGLGLAAVSGIVLNHGGCVTVTSSEQGTTFTILLPRAGGSRGLAAPAPIPA